VIHQRVRKTNRLPSKFHTGGRIFGIMFGTYRGMFNMSYTMTLDVPQKEAS